MKHQKPVIACPNCGSRSTRVYSTERPVRRHRCETCGCRFKSAEVRVIGEPLGRTA